MHSSTPSERRREDYPKASGTLQPSSYTGVRQKRLVHRWGAHSRASSLSLWSARNPHEIRLIGLLCRKTSVSIGTEKGGGSINRGLTLRLVLRTGALHLLYGFDYIFNIPLMSGRQQLRYSSSLAKES